MVVACENNLGPGSLRNIGLQYATGTYVSFVDADDVVDAAMFSCMYEIMQLHDVDIVECGYKTFSEMAELSSEEPLNKLPQKHNNTYLTRIETPRDRGRFVLYSLKTAVWGRLYKKGFLDDNAIYFPANMTYGEDNFFSGLAMLTCKSYYHIGDELYYYYNNAAGITNRTYDNERIHQLVDIMKLYINELDARGFLDVSTGKLAGYAAEFEWYMIYKYFIDPVSFVVSRNLPDWREQVSHFGKELLQFFPEAYNNVYLTSDEGWKDYVVLLREAEV